MKFIDFLFLLDRLDKLKRANQRRDLMKKALLTLSKKKKLPILHYDGKVIYAFYDENNKFDNKEIYLRTSNLNWERDGYLGKYYNGKSRIAIRNYENIYKVLYKFEVDNVWFPDPINPNIEWDEITEGNLKSNMNSVLFFHPYPSWPDGRMEKFTYKYKYEGLEIIKDIFVSLPPNYDRQISAYPVLYLNNGEHYATYLKTMKILVDLYNKNEIVLFPIIVMIPEFTNNLQTVKINDIYNPNGNFFKVMELFFINGLIKHIDQNYRTLKESKYRTIGGFGTGGYFSLYLGLNYPEIFNNIIINSVDINNLNNIKKFTSKLHTNNTNIILFQSGKTEFLNKIEEIIKYLKNNTSINVEHTIYDEEDKLLKFQPRLKDNFKKLYSRYPIYENNHSENDYTPINDFDEFSDLFPD